MRVVSSEELAAYKPLCEALAKPLVGIANAEHDDLTQEGWIFCWRSLQRGITPSKDLIRKRQFDWLSYLRRHNVNYEDVMEADGE